MEKFPLSLKDFELANELSLDPTWNLPFDSPTHFILEVDLHYTDFLQNPPKDYPLAPKTNEEIGDEKR